MDYEDMLLDLMPEGWEIDLTYGAFDATLTCPHGNEIEMDGICPEGCESPLRTLGMI